jgi:hypothetical protein
MALERYQFLGPELVENPGLVQICNVSGAITDVVVFNIPQCRPVKPPSGKWPRGPARQICKLNNELEVTKIATVPCLCKSDDCEIQWYKISHSLILNTYELINNEPIHIGYIKTHNAKTVFQRISNVHTFSSSNSRAAVLQRPHPYSSASQSSTYEIPRGGVWKSPEVDDGN